MKISANHLQSHSDAVLENSLGHRLAKQNTIASNLVNANTPGFRALGYSFENQLQAAVGNDGGMPMKSSNSKHMKAGGLAAEDVKPDVFVKPTESIGNDGNTVDVDAEMAELAETQIMYKATVELLNRRFAMMKYGINGGR
jgi:flagellar basal-body rod protein FlgB